MTNLIIHMLFLAILVFTIFLIIVDIRIPRKKKKYPLITFIVPCYNCEKTVKESIKSIYNSYKKEKIELIAIDDKSTDSTLKILSNLAEKYGFKIIKNRVNIGKTKSINKVWRKSNGQLIWIFDADTVLNKISVDECLRRLYSNEKVGAVSCRYKIIKKGLLSWMVGLEFNMLAITHSAYNVSTALSLWGGCSVYKRKAFKKIKGLRENMIVEDMDSALRLGEEGYKVEQCFTPVLTYAPDTLKGWMKQKVRWASGGMQCIFYHPLSFLKNPLSIFFTLIYSMGIIFSSIEISYIPFLNISYFTSIILMGLISSPYLLIEVEKFSDLKKIFYVFLFVIIYYPIFLIITIYGFFKGVIAYYKLKKGERGW